MSLSGNSWTARKQEKTARAAPEECSKCKLHQVDAVDTIAADAVELVHECPDIRVLGRALRGPARTPHPWQGFAWKRYHGVADAGGHDSVQAFPLFGPLQIQ